MENNENSASSCCNGVSAYVWAVGGALLIVAGLVYVMRIYTTPAPLGAERAAYRLKTLTDLRAENQEVLFNEKNYVWLDAKKGIVRMPVNRAKELFLKMYENPEKGRADLIAREEKATAVPPPVNLE